MSCSSAIYTANTSNPQIVVAAGSTATVPLGNVIRRFGRNLALDGSGITCCGSGYYDVECSLTVQPTAAGAITAQLYQDGVAVPGALATASTTTAGNPVALPITALVRNCGCDCNTVLTVRVNASCTVANCAVVVEKV